jgi:hypothetical protein
MKQVPRDLGQRIVEAARLAVQMHQAADGTMKLEHGRQGASGDAGLGLVREDAPPAATGSPWTWAGKNPAGSFVNSIAKGGRAGGAA